MEKFKFVSAEPEAKFPFLRPSREHKVSLSLSKFSFSIHLSYLFLIIVRLFCFEVKNFNDCNQSTTIRPLAC
ncbi:hypothetical protein BpHYR1_030130 [Brachionus plicatilis]|uniref:Uncharacterized protein n=1 Tax=Brachionus plicatilis TaxID=10195 RepID=A0A3M7RME4_BRAPC|nr:hypothetical protein BpHYR1_030130 [Brachionus plicatilis]